MTEVFTYQFIQRALIAGVLVSILCGLMSVFVVLRRMSFIGAGISHAAFGGVAIGFFFGINPTLTAVVYAVLTAALIDQVVQKGALSEDAAIGIFFSASMAIGIIFIGLSKNYSVDLFGYLFGNILTVESRELYEMTAISLGTVVFIIFNFRKLYIMSFNEELAYVSGVKTARLKLYLLLLLSVIIVISMKVVGLILVSALLVIPAAMARLITINIYKIIIFSVCIALFSAVSGLLVSYQYDLPSGGAIVLVLSTVFFATLGLQKIKTIK